MTEPEAPSPPVSGDNLDPERLRRLLRKLPGWQLSPDGRRIVRQLTFPSPLSSLLFVFTVLELAAGTDRVPFVDVRGNKLLVVLGEPEAGVSGADLALARRINLGD